MSPRARRPRSSHAKGKPQMPFSLILPPAELNALREIAVRKGISVAAVIRFALNQVIFKSHPEVAKSMVENDTDALFDRLSEKLPGGGPSAAVKARLKKQLLRGLLKK